MYKYYILYIHSIIPPCLFIKNAEAQQDSCSPFLPGGCDHPIQAFAQQDRRIHHPSHKRDLATDEAHRWGLKTHTWPFEWGKYGKMQCIFLASIFLGAPISRQSYVGRSYKYVGFVGMLTAFRCDSHFCERIPLHKWMLAPHSLSWCPPTSWSSFCSFQSVLFQFSC